MGAVYEKHKTINTIISEWSNEFYAVANLTSNGGGSGTYSTCQFTNYNLLDSNYPYELDLIFTYNNHIYESLNMNGGTRSNPAFYFGPYYTVTNVDYNVSVRAMIKSASETNDYIKYLIYYTFSDSNSKDFLCNQATNAHIQFIFAADPKIITTYKPGISSYQLVV